MEVDLLRLCRDVLGRDVGVDSRVDADRPPDGAPLSRELGDSFTEELDIELEAERGQVPVLLGAEQLARPADLEVAHRDRESGAELGVVGERRQAGARLRRQLRGVRIEQVRVGEQIGAADPPSDLVQLREAQRVGALDDQRVRLRDVEARLDDRRRDEDVRVSPQERQHPLLQLALAHLSVPDDHPQARDELPDPVGRHVDRLDPVVQIERLAAARDLAFERRLDELLVVLADVRADRAPALREESR